MLLEQLIEYPKGTLMFHRQHLCWYCPTRGVVITNGVCIVSPTITKVNCEFTGSLERIMGKEYKRLYQYQTYDTVIFLSKVSIKLSSINNGYIKKVYFLNDAELEIDIDIKNLDHSLIFGVPNDKNANIVKFCKEYNLEYEVPFSSKLRL